MMNNNVGSIISTFSTSSSMSGTVSQGSTLSADLSCKKDFSGNIMATVLKGLSAYEIAKLNGFTGTESEWLNSLKATITKLNHTISIGPHVFDGSSDVVIDTYDGGLSGDETETIDETLSTLSSELSLQLATNDNMTMIDDLSNSEMTMITLSSNTEMTMESNDSYYQMT